MVNFPCCPKKKVIPQAPVVVTNEVITPKIEPKEKPYGYVQLYAGVKTTNNNYSSPVISLHTYVKDRKVTTRTKATVDPIIQSTHLPIQNHTGPSSSTKTDKQEIEEKVRCIPVEDIISISYSTDIKKEYQTFETAHERARTPKPKPTCCGEVKQCFIETFCRCSCCPCDCCKPPAEKKPKYDIETTRNETANRMILIEMKCVRHANIHIPSHVQVLSDEQKLKFYKDNFQVDSIEFYLVNNTDTDGENDFESKRHQADDLIRTVVQLRNMDNHYPSSMELKEILQQQQTALFGDEIHD